MSLTEHVLRTYLDFQASEVAIEAIDKDNLILSFPFFISSHARVEVAISRISRSDFVLSDLGQTLGEIQDAGFSINQNAKVRIKEILQLRNLGLRGSTIVRLCKEEDLGRALNEFVEGAKTIGDSYLCLDKHGNQSEIDKTLRRHVKQSFEKYAVPYTESHPIRGVLENHEFDFFAPPNGAAGIAVAVLVKPDRMHTEAWGFRTQDIKNSENRDLHIALFYNAQKASETSRRIMDQVADAAIPSTNPMDLDEFIRRVRSHE